MYLSPEEVKSWLGDSAGQDEDALDDLELRAIAILEGETRRRFLSVASTTVIVDGDGTNSLYVADSIVALTKVETRDDVTGSWVEVDGAAFETQGRRILRIDGALFPLGIALVRITYTRGHSVASLPKDFVQAALDLMGYLWKRRPQEAAPSAPVDGQAPDRYPYTVWQFIRRHRSVVPAGF